MASASSSSSSSSFSKFRIKGDVFIHCLGDDIRRNFVSHLSSALVQAGVKPYLLTVEVQREQFVASIEGFQIGIVVLTRAYFESFRCVDELVRIIECHETHGLMVMPVFYEIDRSEFGNTLKATAREVMEIEHIIWSGEYQKTWFRRWNVALTKAATLPNWEESEHRSDAELVEEIVESVLAKLDRPLCITKFPVRLETHVKNVIGLFENQPTKVCMIGIWGMGGSGKTTVAKAIYNQIPYTFGDKNFIQGIREVCETDGRGLVHVQEKLPSDALKTNVKTESGEMKKITIESRLFGKKLFIVLDDVNEIDQLKDLCGNDKRFGQGSVIIITTRNLDLLYQLNVDYVYEMDKLDENDSIELFSWHAFREAKPREDFIKLARSAVAYCGGLPLALEVLGSYLSKRSVNEWRSVLSKLETIPNTHVQKILKISFDGLRETEKNIFLDVCCFFIGKDRDYVTEILNGCGLPADIGIKVLIERGLVKIEKNNELGMHYLLRDMGREIVRQTSTMQPGKRSRLWLPKDVLDVLTKNTGTEAIEGLSLNCQFTSSYLVQACAFEKMKRLRFLQLDNVQMTGDYGYLSKQLRWIYWQGFPLQYIPNNFYLKEAIVIDFQQSNLRLMWKEPQVLPWLKILNLSHSKFLIETPDFSKLPSLEKLILNHCPRLRKVHQSIGDLHNLQLINLKGCRKLRNLPTETYKLKSLKTLILSGCLKIHILEEDLLRMESLTTLISENTVVKQVPFSIVSSKSIGHILLGGNNGLSFTVFHSIISWISPKINLLSGVRPFRGISSSLVSTSMENNDLGDLAPILSSDLNILNVLVQCDVEFQRSQQVIAILDEIRGLNLTEFEIRPSTPETSKRPLRPYLIEFGSYQEKVFDILSESIFKGSENSASCDVFLPGDKDPYWLAHMGEGHSVTFTIPEDRRIKGMTLCAVNLYNPRLIATSEYLISILMFNYTKCTIQIYRRKTVQSFSDVDWQGIISNLGPGDKVEIFVIFGDKFLVKKIAVYLMCDGLIDKEVDPSLDPKNIGQCSTDTDTVTEDDTDTNSDTSTHTVFEM